MTKLTFIKGDTKTEIEAQNGLSILEVAEQNNIEFIKDQIEKHRKPGEKLKCIAFCTNIQSCKLMAEELYGNCGGNCACGSCHIYIDEEHLNKIEKPSEEEENVLDIVFNLQQNSRLACQVFVCDELDGAIITIPE